MPAVNYSRRSSSVRSLSAPTELFGGTTVPLPAFDPARTARLEELLVSALGRPVSLFAEQPQGDVEATRLDGPHGPVLLLINWDFTNPAKVQLRRPVGNAACTAAGFSILRDAAVAPVEHTLAGERCEVELAPQEARLLKVSNAPRPRTRQDAK